jgi:transcriptional adapter 2-alpha
VIPPLKDKVQPSQPANHEITGYMPGRLEFDQEFDNEAEVRVKDMVFNEDDSRVEKGSQWLLWLGWSSSTCVC